MFRIVSGFFEGLLSLRWPWRIWISLLIVANSIAPLWFWSQLEARVILVAFLVGAVVQMAIFGQLGFVRLLGLGHLLVWLPMILWLWTRLPAAGTASPFGRLLLSVIVIDVLSLLIDITDVGRYLAGDRSPTLTAEDL